MFLKGSWKGPGKGLCCHQHSFLLLNATFAGTHLEPEALIGRICTFCSLGGVGGGGCVTAGPLLRIRWGINYKTWLESLQR